MEQTGGHLYVDSACKSLPDFDRKEEKEINDNVCFFRMDVLVFTWCPHQMSRYRAGRVVRQMMIHLNVDILHLSCTIKGKMAKDVFCVSGSLLGPGD